MGCAARAGFCLSIAVPRPFFRETHKPIHGAWLVRAGISALTLPPILPEEWAGNGFSFEMN